MEKLLEKGKGWLDDHPEKKIIVTRYLKHQRSLTNEVLETLISKDEEEMGEKIELTEETNTSSDPLVEKVLRIHDQRLLAAKDALLNAGCKRVVDLGCGEGRLMKLLVAEKQFEYVLGMDVSYRSLEIAK